MIAPDLSAIERWSRAAQAAAAVPSPFELPSKKVLIQDVAALITHSAKEEAKKQGDKVTIVIVDDGGHVLRTERLDGAMPASQEIATGKAKASAMYRKPSRDLEDMINKGRIAGG